MASGKVHDAVFLRLRNFTISTKPLKLLDQTALMHDIITGMDSGDSILQLYATQVCSKLLDYTKYPPINWIISEGIIPRCIKLLPSYPNSALQFEASWILAILTSGRTSETTMIVVQNGAIPELVQLLKSPDMNVAEHAVWALGNIAGDNPGARQQVLAYNCMPLLLNLIKTPVPISLTRHIVRASANLCEHEDSPPSPQIISMALKIFNRFLIEDDPVTCGHACRALWYLTGGDRLVIQAVVDSGVIPKIVSLLKSTDITILFPAVSVLGNISIGNRHWHEHNQSIINAGGLESLKELIQHEETQITEVALKTLNNIIAGTHNPFQVVINAGVLPSLFKVIHEGDGDAQKEAAKAIGNLLSDGSVFYLRRVILQGLLTPFLALLRPGTEQTAEHLMAKLMSTLHDAEKIASPDQVKVEPTHEN